MSTHEIVLARSAASQHGLVVRTAARRLGVTAREIDRRVDDGLLIHLHEGVYQHAAAPLTPKGRMSAAVLACGAGAVASHRSAAWLHDLRGVPRWRSEITVGRTRLPRHLGMALHRTDQLEPVDVTSVDRIPVTTVARTLLDLGAVVPFEVVELAAQDAMIRDLVSGLDLICVLERVGKRGRRGTAALRAVVRGSLPPEGIESPLELDLLQLIESCPVPPPVLQHEIVIAGRRYRLDVAWPHRMVIAEADGRRWHSTRQEFERDLQRSRAIVGAGWRHYRYGWADVHQRPMTVRTELIAALT